MNTQPAPVLTATQAPARRQQQRLALIPSGKERIGVLALLFSLILSLALTATPAQAATITVTTTADSGAGSLRQAINNAVSGDTITFALPNPSTITLNTELVIAKNLTIQGPGAAALTISGANKTRIFFINPGANGATSGPPNTSWIVTIANLTLANGKALGTNGNYISPITNPNMGGGGGGGAGLGGAIFSNNSQLTIRGVIFSANRAQGGTSGSSRLPSGNAAGFGGGGMGSPSVHGASYGVDGGALGGRGGAVAISGGLQGTYPNGITGPIGYPGGEGAGGGGGFLNTLGPGGVGGFGGGGGGGGGISDKRYGKAGGPGGAGGFGGGGGGGGGVYQAYGIVAGGAGGQFGGNGGRGGTMLTQGATGGGGAGLGGAIFVRAGALTLIDSSFLNNNATGGQGFPEVFAGPGQGKGGAIFFQSTGTSLTMSGCATFSGNSAANAAGSAGDNHNIYGRSLTALPLCAAGGVAGAAVAADTGAIDAAQPVTVTALEAAPVMTDSVPVSVPAAVEVAPVVTDSVPVSVPVAVEAAPVVTDSVPVSVLVPIAVAPVITESVPVVAEAPAVTTTQNITPSDAGVAPVDANAPDSSGQNQRLFLPIITNLAGAALRSPGGLALLVLVGLVVVGGLVRRRRRTKG